MSFYLDRSFSSHFRCAHQHDGCVIGLSAAGQFALRLIEKCRIAGPLLVSPVSPTLHHRKINSFAGKYSRDPLCGLGREKKCQLLTGPVFPDSGTDMAYSKDQSERCPSISSSLPV
jgi:hypothetical protein